MASPKKKKRGAPSKPKELRREKLLTTVAPETISKLKNYHKYGAASRPAMVDEAVLIYDKLFEAGKLDEWLKA